MATDDKIDVMALSDDDFSNLDLNALDQMDPSEPAEASPENTEAVAAAKVDANTQEAETTTDDALGASDAAITTEGDDTDAPAVTDNADADADAETDNKKKTETDDDKAGTDAKDKEAKADETTDDKKSDDTSTADSAEQLKKLYAPFKANGKDMQIDNVDDAISLMQMGANYNKKMAGLKPSLRLIKMLENNDLLDEGKLNRLIDIDKKNPDALKQLFKDSGLDPLDFDKDESSEYKPNTYTVDDSEVELDNVLAEIKDSPKFKDTIEVISNKWDQPSKKALVENPGIIKVLNEHQELGIYDQIVEVVEREKVLGRLNGMSDIQAYKHVGDSLHAQGKFAPAPGNSETPAPAPAVQVKTAADPSLKDRKRAASNSTGAVTKKDTTGGFNPLSVSDEEFEKLSNSKFL